MPLEKIIGIALFKVSTTKLAEASTLSSAGLAYRLNVLHVEYFASQ